MAKSTVSMSSLFSHHERFKQVRVRKQHDYPDVCSMALAGGSFWGLGFWWGPVGSPFRWKRPERIQVPAQVVSSELGFRVDSDNNRERLSTRM